MARAPRLRRTWRNQLGGNCGATRRVSDRRLGSDPLGLASDNGRQNNSIIERTTATWLLLAEVHRSQARYLLQPFNELRVIARVTRAAAREPRDEDEGGG